MKIISIEQVEQLRWLIEGHFGYFPDNLIIESPEIVEEALHHMNYGNQPKPESLTNLKLFGVRVAKEITEVETIERHG
jgi:hypothetical protein